MPPARLLRANTIGSSRLDRYALLLVVHRPLLTLALLSLLGCAGQGTTRTGFLSSYDGMGPTDDHTRDLIFVDPRFVPADYAVVVVDPIVWSPKDGAPPRDPATVVRLKALSSALPPESDFYSQTQALSWIAPKTLVTLSRVAQIQYSTAQ